MEWKCTVIPNVTAFGNSTMRLYEGEPTHMYHGFWGVYPVCKPAACKFNLPYAVRYDPVAAVNRENFR